MRVLQSGALAAALVFTTTASAAVQQVDFTMLAVSGETATGFITYDDTVVGDGDAISGGGLCDGPDNSIEYEINISGGNFDGVTFTKADCSSQPAFCNVPDFTLDVNFFGCAVNGVIGDGVTPNTFLVSDGENNAELVFQNISDPTPASPEARAIPTASFWGLTVMSLLLGLLGYRRLKV